MQTVKTLWMLDIPYGNGKWSTLVPFYAVDEQEAWIEVRRWALRNERLLPENTMLVHFPQGFTVHRSVLPGRLEESQ